MAVKPPGMWETREDQILIAHRRIETPPADIAKLLNRLVSSVEIRARVLGKPFG